MRRISLIISFCLLCILCSCFSHTKTNSEIRQKTKDKIEYKILFVGNSLTYYNNLPKLVEKEAQKQGISLYTEMLAYPNYGIVDHWAYGKVQTLIKTKGFDYVIIQQGPSSRPDGKYMLINDGEKYSRLCKENNAKLVYFMVWPARVYYDTFSGVISNYTKAAQLNDAILCPVGSVWKDYFDNTNDFSYYSEDEFHPSVKGSKVAAEVIVKTLFE